MEWTTAPAKGLTMDRATQAAIKGTAALGRAIRAAATVDRRWVVAMGVERAMAARKEKTGLAAQRVKTDLEERKGKMGPAEKAATAVAAAGEKVVATAEI